MHLRQQTQTFVMDFAPKVLSASDAAVSNEAVMLSQAVLQMQCCVSLAKSFQLVVPQ